MSWKYWTTRSNTSGSARREMKPISFIADTIRVVSRVIAPCRNDIIPRRMFWLTDPVAPKSRNTTAGWAAPSGVAWISRFPGCGSAWYRPSTKICSQ